MPPESFEMDPFAQENEGHGISAWRRWVVQFDISHNAMSLAFFAFTAMWQTAALHFGLHSTLHTIGQVFFFISCAVLFLSAGISVLRVIIFPSAISIDFNHPRLVSLFFLPVLIGTLCMQTTPPYLRSPVVFKVGFYILSAYQAGMALYLFGEWLFAANPPAFIYPLVFMQTIGFFLLANVGAAAHLLDQAYAMFSIGCLLWLLVLITNFQHVARVLEKGHESPQPTFFLFIAPPAQAAISVVVLSAAESAEDISGLLDISAASPWPHVAQAFLYIDLFIYLLMFRILPTFWKTDFSFAWWAYVFPLSAAASAVIWRYNEEELLFWGILGVGMAVIACIAMVLVSCRTILAVSSGRLPRNESCLSNYEIYFTGGKAAENFVDLEGNTVCNR